MRKSKSANYEYLMDNKEFKYKENDPDYQGERMDDDLVHGPRVNRSCTDILCLILFLAAWVGIIIVAVGGIKNAKTLQIAQPFDSDGKACGVDQGYEKFPNLYFTQPQQNLNLRVCVQYCPQQNQTVDQNWCKTNSLVSSCTQNIDLYPTVQQSLTHFCQPNNKDSQQNQWAYNQINKFLNLGNIQEYINDIQESWPIILACTGFAIIFGFIFMLMLKSCAGCLIWGGILVYLVGLSASGLYFFYKYKDTGSNDQFNIENFRSVNKKDVFITTAVTLWSIGGISLLIILCMFKRIKLAIAIITAASEFIQDVKSIFLAPIIVLLSATGVFVLILASTLFLYSQGDIQKLENNPFATVNLNEKTKYQIAFNIFMLIWNMEFFIAINLFVISVATADWYFSEGYPRAPVVKGFKYTLLHMGSLAFGSLILVIIWTIKFIWEFLHKKLKNYGGNGGCFVQFTIKCVTCCLDCFERFVRFLNTQAYIQMSINGKGFCTSAYEAFYLTLRNAGRFATLNGVGSIIIWIGKLFISTCSAILGYLIITNSQQFIDKIQYPVAPTIVFAIVSFIISEVFMGVYGMSADAILFCYCIDEEIHQRRGNIAQKCPKPLREFMKEHWN